jgi:hypothetical protein
MFKLTMRLIMSSSLDREQCQISAAENGGYQGATKTTAVVANKGAVDMDVVSIEVMATGTETTINVEVDAVNVVVGVDMYSYHVTCLRQYHPNSVT